ncbi:AraC family transcriptional regulator [Streptomyces sp. KAU_LT]|uniref:helix-turn-helix domain-containing protein n=1 Tax=Streptomyces sp. KAU_LT TaxID=3046669 RepID=UPI0024B730B5|nr:AraC family transcriptional regulator [Streptomyces sp. KAU_LT]MDI9836049.1 AraC family transcriptional regulator [Streptomyces sp. KAU_LT]
MADGAFPTVVNSGYTVKITHGGSAPPFQYLGRTQSPPVPGAVTVIEPDEVVSCLAQDRAAADGQALVQLMFIDADLMPVGTARPRFHGVTYPDRGLFGGIAALHRGLADSEDELDLESSLIGLLNALLDRHADDPGAASPALRPRALRHVREMLHSQLDSNIRLDDLAAVAGCSKRHLIRSFRQAYGVPPHHYRTLLRLARAKTLLAAGRSVAETAAELGYCDQSQLNRHFRREFGMSAGGYARTVR